ncbi:FmdB family zinc ribbon protein [Agrococcus jejuensis]|uniref:Putative regulatory protein, FmdB family n=1 Tax=Agrococcus jejuensis TaxID=399736 RepID=A0A1G8B982_9MICO|nr:FmdB family zinc ribbon protein [Agrococcus jejuensis]SDH29755.1 putative regulatory protein, FmdB family [Agrococcus jejuensis]
MPVYAYQCTACGTAIEVRQSFTDDALTVCEACGGRLRKRFDTIGVTFKGSGFYRTDSRAGASGGSASKDSGSSSSSSSSKSSSSKSEGSSSSSGGSSVSSSSS